MNLQRRTHPGAGLTTAVVLLCGIVSGAAMAAGNQRAPAVQGTPQVGVVPTPSIPGIPSVPGIQQPTTQGPGSVTRVATPTSVQMLQRQAAVPVKSVEQPATLDDALVLRPETPYERKTARSEVPAVPLEAAQGSEDDPSLGTGNPLAGLNLGGLGLFMFALLGGAGFLAYRKRQDEVQQAGDLILEVASTIRIGAKWQISLVRVPGRILVVGATERGLELLTELYPEGDEEVMDDLLSTVSGAPNAQLLAPQPTLSRPAGSPEPAPADAFDPLADISPRYDHNAGAPATYARQTRRPAAAPTATQQVQASGPPQADPSALHGHDDAFLDAVLDRLSKARPAVIRHTTKPAPRVDERAALRAQVKQYRRGPTRL
jgi:flagellar biogenesis protein FliO